MQIKAGLRRWTQATFATRGTFTWRPFHSILCLLFIFAGFFFDVSAAAAAEEEDEEEEEGEEEIYSGANAVDGGNPEREGGGGERFLDLFSPRDTRSGDDPGGASPWEVLMWWEEESLVRG